jgi:hypothetical protein
MLACTNCVPFEERLGKTAYCADVIMDTNISVLKDNPTPPHFVKTNIPSRVWFRVMVSFGLWSTKQTRAGWRVRRAG